MSLISLTEQPISFQRLISSNEENQELNKEERIKQIRDLIQNAPLVRNKDYYSPLIKLLDEIPFFSQQELTRHDYLVIAPYFQVLEMKAGQFIYHMGAINRKCYIIFDGTVINKIKGTNKECPNKQEFSECELKYPKIFGEQCLISERKLTSDSAHCKTDCEFLILDCEPYHNLMKDISLKKLFAKVQFFKNIPFFAGISKKYLSKQIPLFNVKNCIKEQIIYEPGQSAEFVYVVINGEFESTCYFESPKKQITLVDAILNKNIKAPLRNECFLRKNPNIKQVNLKIYCKGQIFGDD